MDRYILCVGKSNTREGCLVNIPSSTYRIQLTPTFGFQNAQEIIPYLKSLGISHIYLSPIFEARPGSTHGYDVVNPCAIRKELGGEKAFLAFAEAAYHHNLGIIIDIVPNHMAFHSDNFMLMDIFEFGKHSRYYEFFDIDWEHPYENLQGRVLVPILGKFYADALQDGELKLVYRQECLGIQYYEHFFPLRIDSYIHVLGHNLKNFEERFGTDNADFVHYMGIMHFFSSFHALMSASERYKQAKYGKQALWNLHEKSDIVQTIMAEILTSFNGAAGDQSSYTALDQLIVEQIYRLSFWKVATEEINYRRFFTVNDLISVRIEERQVFDTVHALVIDLWRKKLIDGVRIDHIDGLYDPATYLNWLRAEMPDAFIVVEKILEADEKLPEAWPVAGTTGYDFLTSVNNIFCDSRNERAFSKLYYKYAQLQTSYDNLVYEKKRLILGKHMAGNIDNLAQYIKSISSRDPYGRDITLYALRRALVEIIAHFPVYRTYINEANFSEQDKKYIQNTFEVARSKHPEWKHEFHFIEKFFLLDDEHTISLEDYKERLHFIMLFQQQTGPLMAKGFEDTVFYIFNRLISLNEVGGNPASFGWTLEEFHSFQTNRSKNFPLSLNATSTHDTKRGEDARARINVLSENANEWAFMLKKCTRSTRNKRVKTGYRFIPEPNDAYFLFQTLLGSWPFSYTTEYIDRIKEFIVKAVREAKVHTAWIKPDEEYEESFVCFVEKILGNDKRNRFLANFNPFEKKISFYGCFNALSQLMLKLTCPGVPDIYQGTEYWDLSLVDPDNRREVDFQSRTRDLEYISQKIPENVLALVNEMLENKEDGRIKMFLLHRVLHARRNYAELFAKGSYVPLLVEGERKDSLIAFARKYKSNWAVVVVPRFYTNLTAEGSYPFGNAVWQNTRIVIPESFPHTLEDVVTSQHRFADKYYVVGDILTHFPVSLLIGNTDKT